MLQKTGASLLLLAILSSLNIHWALLQGVAWASMLQKESQRTETIQEAFERTFGGEFPCEICGLVQDNLNQDTDSEKAVEAEWVKIKLLPLSLKHNTLKIRPQTNYGILNVMTPDRLKTPPATPPPRV